MVSFSCSANSQHSRNTLITFHDSARGWRIRGSNRDRWKKFSFFLKIPIPVLGPTQHPVQWAKGPGREIENYEEVELHLCSHCML